MKKDKKLIIRISIYIFLIIFYLIIINNQSFTNFWIYHVSKNYINIIGSVTNFIPFSLFDIFLIFILFCFIISIYKFFAELKHKRIHFAFKNLKKILYLFLDMFISYCLLVSVLYYREPINLSLYQEEITTTLVDEAIEYFLKDYNNLSTSFAKNEKGVSICPYSFNTLREKILIEMKCFDDNPYFFKHSAKAKSTIYSPLLSELHITGINFFLTGEANINTAMPSIDIPFTIAHEIAHSKGIMRENDANLVALYICLNSNDEFIRYSGYFRGFFSLLNINYYTNYEKYKTYFKQINPYIIKDITYYNDYFEKHDLLNNLSKFFNNLYLKLNGQKDGVHSYDDVAEIENTGQVDQYGNPIYNFIEYSPYQKLMFEIYRINN